MGRSNRGEAHCPPEGHSTGTEVDVPGRRTGPAVAGSRNGRAVTRDFIKIPLTFRFMKIEAAFLFHLNDVTGATGRTFVSPQNSHVEVSSPR